jgi:transcriptional regulator of acetoin/glycerol metabolism
MEAAWHAFVLDGRVDTCVRPEIRRSWERARRGLVHPGLAVSPRALAPRDVVARVEGEEAFRLASPLVSEFASRLAGDGHVVGWFDGDGVMLALDGDHRSRDRLAEVNFAPGSCWAENAVGTNGPGTALAEARPVEVFASEHFVAAWQPWTCASAPVRFRGRVVGAVDITSPWEVHNPTLLLTADALARAVEGRLEAEAARSGTAALVEVLRQAMSARDEFLASAAHEIRTPLTPLRLKLQTLRRRLEREGAAVNAGHVVETLRGTEQDFRRVVESLDAVLAMAEW